MVKSNLKGATVCYVPISATNCSVKLNNKVIPINPAFLFQRIFLSLKNHRQEIGGLFSIRIDSLSISSF